MLRELERIIPSVEFEHYVGTVGGDGLQDRPAKRAQVALELSLVVDWPHYSTIVQQTKSWVVAGGRSGKNWHRHWRSETASVDCCFHFELHCCWKSVPDWDTRFDLLSSLCSYIR